eukprot:1809784-Alexandrium_andersonii.AAC.1
MDTEADQAEGDGDMPKLRAPKESASGSGDRAVWGQARGCETVPGAWGSHVSGEGFACVWDGVHVDTSAMVNLWHGGLE